MASDLKATLARNLKATRLQAGLSQSDLARKAGTPQPRVALMESSANPTLPSLEWLARVASALGVAVASLFEEAKRELSQSLSTLPEDAENLAAHLRELGAPLSGSSKKNRSFSPEAVVLGVLRVVPSARMVECLPGLLATGAMDCEKLFRLAKERNLVNRLGFVVEVAALLAEQKRLRGNVSPLRSLAKKLWKEKVTGTEDYLMAEKPVDPELRDWVKKKTPHLGTKWGVYGAYSLERFSEAFRRAA
jgi:transcriptional regulator with XRE-family HTH domain